MIPTFLIEKIRLRAHEIWQYRMENDIFFTTDRLGNVREITAQDDWVEAEDEILRQVRKDWQ